MHVRARVACYEQKLQYVPVLTDKAVRRVHVHVTLCYWFRCTVVQPQHKSVLTADKT